ncbi:hypothetical protein FA95DRAFT_1674075 [Auriscalpium vulgare]|uniref:Uncharacterized protein n=1 Tax=Auriscalpium vulgare TaxID=40419 RepID=A0ACB8SCB9_9AGAM|nr:hypothetical protein FA95DRAFT_1674075 [Auriscalpium vulgare]
MPRRARPRLTLPRKKKSQNPQPRRMEISDQKWNALNELPHCTLANDRYDDVIFTEDNTALVWPDTLALGVESPPLEDLWVANIISIRGASQFEDVWVQVQWWYSGKHIQDHRQMEDPKYSFGSLELCLSDHYTIIPFECLYDKTEVLEYKENEVTDHKYIDENKFYTRSFLYHSSTKELTPPLYHPDRPLKLCLCGKSYNPDGPDPMHFCPQPGCSTWYHAECLVSGEAPGPYILNCTPYEHGSQLLYSNPDFRSEEMEDIPDVGAMDGTTLGLNDLDQTLVVHAKQQIIKGAGIYGVVGNQELVVEARRWVYRLCSRDDPGYSEHQALWLTEGVKLLDKIKLEESQKLLTIVGHSDDATSDSYITLKCPKCATAI